MSDEDGLPVRTRPASSHPFSTTSLRKRSRGHSSSYSSDAAFFSSDDLADASIDNYASPRRKKQHRRAWWQSEAASSLQAKRSLKQPVDSGVFLSSDSTGNSSSGSSSNDDGFSVEALSGVATKANNKRATAFTSPSRRQKLQGEDLARRIVQSSEEAGDEKVDLSGLSLAHLSNHTLRPLRYFIRVPNVENAPQSDDEYQPFTPSLQLFLYSNQLLRVPGEIANLTNLKVLSLRNNKITELPHSVGNLQNLVELNVSSNRLRYLPWELLQLVRSPGKLKNLTVFPNPLLKPFPSHATIGTWNFPSTLDAAIAQVSSLRTQLDALSERKAEGLELLRMSWLLQLQNSLTDRIRRLNDQDVGMQTIPSREPRSIHPWKRDPIRLGSAAVAFFDFDGTVPRSSPAPPSKLGSNVSVLPPTDACKVPNRRDFRVPADSHVPSLYTLALHVACDSFHLSNLLLPDDTPFAISRGLEMAAGAADDGVTICSVCQQRFIIARAEWIEYWHCAPDNLHCAADELFLPFMRRACCWPCAGNFVSQA